MIKVLLRKAAGFNPKELRILEALQSYLGTDLVIEEVEGSAHHLIKQVSERGRSEMIMAIGALPQTTAAERCVDFPVDYYSAPDTLYVKRNILMWLRKSMVSLVTSVQFHLLGVFFLLSVGLPTLGIVMHERGIEDSPFHGAGLAEGIYYAVVTATTAGYGDLSPKTTIGRMLCLPLLVAGVFTFAALFGLLRSVFTATFQSTTMTLADLTANRNIKVGVVVEGDTSYLHRVPEEALVRYRSYQDLVEAMKKGRGLDAVIAPPLVAREAIQKFRAPFQEGTAAGFYRVRYGIAFPEDCDLEEPIRQAMLELEMRGTIFEIIGE